MTVADTKQVEHPSDAAPRQAGWIVSAPFDLLFLANIAWPLLLLPGLVRSDGTLQTEFWQIHFLTTPHRWLTLVLVATDPDRREGRNRLFISFAVLAAFLVAGAWAITGALTCLLLLDYLWNAWHFASQHQGVLRMYARKAGVSGSDRLERYALRAFLVYTILRTAGWSTGWLESEGSSRSWLQLVDLVMLGVPGGLLVLNLLILKRAQTGKLVYLTSLLLLYSGLLLSLQSDWRNGVFALTAASSTFHAVEYIAVVSHYAQRRLTVGSNGLFRRMAMHWVAVLAMSMLALGLIGVFATHPSSQWSRVWMALNVWAAFLHYAYDGFIWKLRRPATAQALGVSAP